jgi:hypothetical protein
MLLLYKILPESYTEELVTFRSMDLIRLYYVVREHPNLNDTEENYFRVGHANRGSLDCELLDITAHEFRYPATDAISS